MVLVHVGSLSYLRLRPKLNNPVSVDLYTDEHTVCVAGCKIVLPGDVNWQVADSTPNHMLSCCENG